MLSISTSHAGGKGHENVKETELCASALSNHQDQQLIILWLLSSETVNVEKYQKYLGIHDCCVVSYLNESACQEPSDYQFSLDILILVTDNWPWYKLVHH